MDRFNQYRVFVQVAEMGSFIRAAHVLEVPRASVSAAVQQLETQLGVRLLHRTTRQVRLTADGEQLLERLRPLLAEVEDIDQSFQASQRQASGRLSVDVPSRIARRLIAPALPSLLRRHPHLQLVLGSADLAEGHRSIGYASPKTGRESPWEYLTDDGHTQRLELPSRVVVNNAESYIACCRAGLGLMQIPRYDVQHLLDAGELVEVLPAYRAASMPIALIYPHRRQRSRRLAVFHEWFESLLQPHLER
ncbi:LysR family transcriptional regulator [Serratia marcescens]|nr:LysR family transcriptional regulator [Serratia marcescens]